MSQHNTMSSGEFLEHGKKQLNACKELRKNNVLVQVNATLTQQNYNQIDEIMSLAESIGVENFHLFFLVPTGRGAKLTDLSPEKYEEMITKTFAKTRNHSLNVRPSCAPQFMRIARGMGLDMRQWIRGCIAGLYYCRIYPNGDVTPCPYLPIKLGNIREETFKQHMVQLKNLQKPKKPKFAERQMWSVRLPVIMRRLPSPSLWFIQRLHRLLRGPPRTD